jgi:ABC-2 type transport system permease protein
MRVFVKLTASELRLFLREPMQVFFTLVVPSIIVIVLGAVPVFREANPDLGGRRVIDMYTGIAVILILASLGLQVAPMALATYRERGILRRLATTPTRPIALLGAQLTTSLLSAVVSVLLVLIVARLCYAVSLPRNSVGFAVAFLFSAAAAFAIGLFIAALARGGKAANSVGTLLFFPAMFFAGLWWPREAFPPALRTIADLTPLGAAERAVMGAMGGQWPAWGSLTVLLAYLLVFGLAAARLFRWE